MSVFYDNHGHDRGYDDDEAPPRARWVAFGASREPARRPRREAADGPLLGLSYERAEGVIQLVLAFALVGGATALLNSNLFSAPPAAPQTDTAALTASAPAAQASPAQAPSVQVQTAQVQAAQVQAAPVEAARVAAPTLMSSSPVEPAAPAAAAPEPAPAAAAPASADSAALFDSRPIAGGDVVPDTAPRPLAPPSPEARERLAAGEQPPAAEAAPAAEAESAPAATPVHEPAKPAEGGRMAKCYLKISGRVQENGSCRIHQSNEQVVFDFPGKPLSLAHDHGRTWIATLGGRTVGKVYQNAHKPCWGARGSGFYACDNS
jgi:hypothetical protein